MMKAMMTVLKLVFMFVFCCCFFFPAMCGIASGVCFIALRDLDNETSRSQTVMPPVVPEYASQDYYWSFMLHWIGTGLAFVDSFILLCLMKNSYESVNEDYKFSPYASM
jgi:hypothetical protein